ncbi:CsbD family protein [Brevundimonas variabilis]|uniref:Uncharacterized protein YjbJ (UPF0337 family) n=1 Tax=Brevundimonas variabilis TaxID=74312 RepID=A0A7W9FGG1_9CAUL|nr:CsbD family protein [Brevundimonas variabilis]MBB5746623.1 uncharacterized protein YjbJ (UPF0337 family) [Brevundimonas variabilis]
MADQDQFKGAAKEVGGNIKEGLGKLTGNEKLQAEGKLDQAEGAVQKKVGDVKSDLKS